MIVGSEHTILKELHDLRQSFDRGIEPFFYWVGADQERYKYPM